MAAPDPAAVRLAVRGLSRRYGGMAANNAIELSVQAGEIHAVLGENGSGKSTLLRCIYGVEQPDAGAIIWNGRTLHLSGPAEARAHGIALVFQHFALIDPLSVLDNVLLHLHGTPLARLSASLVKHRLLELARTLEMPIDPDARVESLSVGARQRVEILRCLLLEPELLMLDEPTAALTPSEISQLFQVLRQIAAKGCSILFVTHRLAEVRALCQRATILRNGRVVAACAPADMSESDLAELMVGAAPLAAPLQRSPSRAQVRLTLDAVCASGSRPQACGINNVQLEIRAGEIVGLAGIAGNGQEVLGDLVTGERSVDSGRVLLDGDDVTSAGAWQRRAAGVQVVPAERTRRGALPTLSLTDNLLLTQARSFTPRRAAVWSRLDRARAEAESTRVMQSHDVRAPGPRTPAGHLSGGNLQRFLVGRALLSRPRVLVCHNPTWGVDLRAAAAIHRRLQDAREDGAAILLISADLDEIYHLADRMAVLSRGRLSEVRPLPQYARAEVGLLMAGAAAS